MSTRINMRAGKALLSQRFSFTFGAQDWTPRHLRGKLLAQLF